MPKRISVLIDDLKELNMQKDKIVLKYATPYACAKAMLEIREELEVAEESGQIEIHNTPLEQEITKGDKT